MLTILNAVVITALANCQEERDKARPTSGVGRFVPTCSDDGTYAPKQCWGSTGQCWCSDKEGNKLIDDVSCLKMKCQGERDEAVKSGKLGVFTPSCEDDGTYSAKQCWGSTGKCWCSDKDGNKLDDDVSCMSSKCQTELKAASGKLGAFAPSCEDDGTYSAKQCWGSTGKCWCSDKDGNKLDDDVSCMSSKCQTELKAASGKLGAFAPSCEDDGTYSAKQCWGSTGQCWCVESSGVKLENDLSCIADSEKPKTCMEAKNLAMSSNRINEFIPKCEQDGKLWKMQQCKSTTECWCVNPTTGVALPSTSLISCAPIPKSDCQSKRDETTAKGPLPGAFMPRCEDDGTYSAKQCWGSTGKCWCSDKDGNKLDDDVSCMSSKCQTELKAASGKLGAFAPSCEDDGTYSAKQCWGSTGKCWCSDKDGNKLDDDMTCMESECQKLRHDASSKLGAFAPSCEDDGTYSAKQCWGSTGKCWCSDKDGNKLDDDVSCMSSKCQTERKAASGKLGAFAPSCEDDGTYSAKQCWGSTGQCWCVESSGVKLENDLSCIADSEKPKTCMEAKNLAMSSNRINEFIPKCEQDGKLWKMQQCKSTTECWCVNPTTGVALPSTSLISCAPIPKSDCQSKRDETTAKGPLPGAFMPRCEDDGTYSAKQCWGSTGKCWCSDKDGNKLDDDVSCMSSKCQTELKAASGKLGAFAPSCEDDGTYSVMQCWGSTGECWCSNSEGVKLEDDLSCLISKCKSMKEKMLKKNLLGSYIPQCNEDGTFSTRQCHGSTGKCWCVNKDGEELNETDCLDSKCEAQIAAATKKGLLGSFRPKCETDGTFSEKQCHGSIGSCWCVDKEGNKLNHTKCLLQKCDVKLLPLCPAAGDFKRRQCLFGKCWCVDSSTGDKINNEECLAEPMSCSDHALKESIKNNPRLSIAKVPRCEEDGSYSEIQCSDSGSSCWCVGSDNTKTKCKSKEVGLSMVKIVASTHAGMTCSEAKESLSYKWLSCDKTLSASYAPQQCTDDRGCYCVDTTTGQPLPEQGGNCNDSSSETNYIFLVYIGFGLTGLVVAVALLVQRNKRRNEKTLQVLSLDEFSATRYGFLYYSFQTYLLFS